MGKKLSPNMYKKVEIKQMNGKGLGIFATCDLNSGEQVIIGKPLYTEARRTELSIQVSWDRHLLFDRPAVLENHSCNPNCGIRNNSFGGFDFIAMRDIAEGEEITWDYAISEYVSMAGVSCRCGSPDCRGTFGGWSTLPEPIRKKYSDFSASYLHHPVSETGKAA